MIFLEITRYVTREQRVKFIVAILLLTLERQPDTYTKAT